VNRRITIKDVAAAAGVHYSTVSLALRNHPRISAEVRDKVKAAAERLGYTPDPVLSALNAYRVAHYSRGGASVLAYLTGLPKREEHREHYTPRSYWEGATARAEQLGYKLEHFWLREPGYTDERWSQILFARGIRGVLLASFPGDQPSLALEWEKFCAVRISQSPHYPPVHTISHNQMQVVRLALQTVRARGYQRPGLVLYPLSDERSSQLWSAGYLVEQQQLAPENRIPALQNAWSKAAVSAWLRTHRPDVVLCNVNHLLVWLGELGIRVPDDLGFVDLNLQGTKTKFAGVFQNHHALAATAVDRLVSLLHTDVRGVPPLEDLTLVSGTWCDGSTLRRSPGSSVQAETSVG
jgi:LacI family transcriptional regulator